MARPIMDERYEQGYKHGYHVGETERLALATANSNLRSELRDLKAVLLEYGVVVV